MSSKAAKKADVVSEDGVILHLDKDPNDPRNRVPAGPLPSLDD